MTSLSQSLFKEGGLPLNYIGIEEVDWPWESQSLFKEGRLPQQERREEDEVLSICRNPFLKRAGFHETVYCKEFKIFKRSQSLFKEGRLPRSYR